MFVFTGVRGAPFHARNFRNRAWKPILDSLGIPYRKPYTTRETIIMLMVLVCSVIDAHQPINVEQCHRIEASEVRVQEAPLPQNTVPVPPEPTPEMKRMVDEYTNNEPLVNLERLNGLR